jgi:Leucine-rich repeat (LRR) protein
MKYKSYTSLPGFMWLSLCLLFSMMHIVGKDALSQPQILESDSLALVALYESTGGESWSRSGGWFEGPIEFQTWTGVGIDTIDGNLRVTGIFLTNNNMTGELPDEIGNLSELRDLRLDDNNLSGIIPSALGNASKLEDMQLRRNQLTGIGDLSGLTNLVQIHIGENPYEPAPLPDWIQSSASTLRTLRMEGSNLTGELPEWLSDMEVLNRVRLQQNALVGEIPLIGKPENLGNAIELWNNQFTSLAPGWGAYSNLGQLRLQTNNLTGHLPEEIGHMTGLSVLRINSNSNLTGPIPMSFTGLVNLNQFDYNGTGLCEPYDEDFQVWLNGIGSSAGTNVTCPPGGMVGDSLALAALYESTNGDNWTRKSGWFEGPIEHQTWAGIIVDTIDGDLRVTEIHLRSNNMTGQLPAELSWMSELRILDLDQNEIGGAIPSELNALTNLQRLLLRDNHFTGAIPDLSGMVSLRRFSLRDVKTLDPGPVPAWFSELPNLTHIFLDETNRTGELPAVDGEWLTHLPIQQIRLGKNQIEGAMPLMGNPETLTSVEAFDNKFSGPIPAGYGEYKLLSNWRIQTNSLSGELPPELGGMTALSTFRIAWNPGLTGPIPMSYLEWPNITRFDYNSTGLCEPDEQAFRDWIAGITSAGTGFVCPPQGMEADSLALAALYESTNGDNWARKGGWFEGPIVPQSWAGIIVDTINGDLRVTEIHLRNNNMTGQLPVELSWMSELRILDLDENAIEGEIPPELNALTKLERLFLRDNKFTGVIPDLSGMVNLRRFSLRDVNTLVPGPVPGWFGNLPNLQRINLDNTNRTGELPAVDGKWLTDLPLEDVRLSVNQLEGEFPLIGNPETMAALEARSNQFTGPIPAGYGEYKLLSNWRIQTNNLSGELPPELGEMTALSVFRIAWNPDLTGPIPMTYLDWPNISQFDYNTTGLCEPDEQAFRDWIATINSNGTGIICGQEPTSTEEVADLPEVLKLHQNYPNPFNPTTTIRFEVPEQSHVRLTIFNIIGQQVVTLVNEEKNVGRYEVHFDATQLSSGTYFYRLEAGGKSLIQSMSLIK